MMETQIKEIERVHVTLPAGYSTRPGKLDDYLQVFELVNAHGMAQNGSPDLNDPEVIRLDWQSEGFNPETDILIVLDADGKMAGLVESWLIRRPAVHPWNWMCVHPKDKGKGIWEYLLQHAEQRSQAALQLTPEDLRVSAVTGTEHSNLEAIRAIEKLGWSQTRSYYRMVTDLQSPPEEAPLPEGITIRPYDPASETEEVYRTMVDSFRDHYGFVEQPFESGFREFKHQLIEEPGYNPDYWFVAMDGDKMAGICLCRPVDMEDAESGWVNELGVRREWRKQGLGGALLKHAFAAFYARGQKRAALGVDSSSLTGALRLYERAGMRVARQFDHFEKELRAGREIRTQTLE